MKTKFIAGLALAAALLIGEPAFAHGGGGDRNHGGGKARVAAVAHRGGGGARVAAAHRGGGGTSHIRVASRATTFHPVAATHRSFTRPNTTLATTHSRATGAVARNTATASANATHGFGGRTVGRGQGSAGTNSGNYAGRNSSGYSGGRGNGGGGNYQYAFASHNGWNHGQQYSWNGHHYRWWDDAWYITDPYPYYAGYQDYHGGYGYGPNVGVEVQQALANAGYYQGPIDGIVGPGTRAAIAAYQRDNGLYVTGTITNDLLNSLGAG